ALSIAGAAPTLGGANIASPVDAALALAGAGSVLDLALRPGAGEAFFGLVAGATPIPGTLTLAGGASVVGVALIPQTATLTIIGSPAGQGRLLTPGVGALALVGQSPSPSAVITPGAGEAFFGLTVSLTPITGALALTGADANLSRSLTPGTGEAFFGLIRSLTPATGALILSGAVPDLSRLLTPATGALILIGRAGGDVVITPRTGILRLFRDPNPPPADLGMTGYAPRLDLGLRTSVGSAAIAGVTPSVAQNLPLTPGAGSA